jgi:pyruvate,water dikinase
MLSALKGQDALVPGGIALTFLAYEKFLEENGLRGLIAGLAAEIDASGDVDRISAEIRKAIFSGRLQPGKGVGKEILEALQAGDGSRWAVRSSAVQEDGDDAAFAGAAESFLFVKPEEILAKVVENWASFWLPRGIRYRMGRGLRGADIRPATLIQEMSPADASGVIFTRDPVSSADEIVINASYGLGEGVVSGAAASDSYTVLKDGTEAELPHIARKRWMIVEDPGPKGTRLAPVPTALRGRRVLTREQTRRLALIAAALERRFGRPMDIEFSIDRGRIVILQARPITSLRAL